MNELEKLSVIRYPRDLLGYGKQADWFYWPGNANLAVQFVINYEEGGENCLLHGDQGSEAFLSEIIGADSWPNQRHWNMESIYEYGARSGYWRLHRIFTEAQIPVTVFGVATALARSPEQVSAMLEANWEIACHGYKWIEYKDFTREQEKEHLIQAVALHSEVVGSRPLGWYTGRCSDNTIDLVAEYGGFQYLADSYADDLPYWLSINNADQLIIPYNLDTNDMRFATAQGFNTGEQFFQYLKDSFDVLYKEGKKGFPKMMSVGLHCRLAGRPGRTAGLQRFIDYVMGKDDVWFPTRLQIAGHWRTNFLPSNTLKPNLMPRHDFLKAFGETIEDALWLAEKAYNLELGPAHNCPNGLHNAFCRIFRTEPKENKLQILRNHPNLAGKLALEGRLGASSTEEQQSAGLDSLTPEELSIFTQFNNDYLEKFAFPFIVAVKDTNKQEILQSMPIRLKRDYEKEFDEACRQVERIAWYRIKAKFEET